MNPKMTAEEKRAWLAAIGELERFYRAAEAARAKHLDLIVLAKKAVKVK